MFDKLSAIEGGGTGACPPEPDDGPEAPFDGSTLGWSLIDDGLSPIGLLEVPPPDVPPPLAPDEAPPLETLELPRLVAPPGVVPPVNGDDGVAGPVGMPGGEGVGGRTGGAG